MVTKMVSESALKKLMVHNASLAKAIRLAKNCDRGWGSQIILNELRNFVENVMFLSAFRNKDADKEYNYENICQAQSIVRGQGKLRFLWKFHDFLQISASHYTLDENASERLMLKYYDCLIDIRSYLSNEFGIQILQCTRELSIINSVNDHSVIRFTVDQAADSDEDNDNTRNVVPFQVAYAVSIHKAQGLEYQSVKIVIASEVGEQITHNIFYTAITRAREMLKIYWSPECEKNVLEGLKIKDCRRDLNLLQHHEKLKNLQ